jgi:hypothetical protein
MDRSNAITAKNSAIRHFPVVRIEYVPDAPARATITVNARYRYPSVLSVVVHMRHSVEIAWSFTPDGMSRLFQVIKLNVRKAGYRTRKPYER